MTQIEMTVPNRWEEVTLGQYIRYAKLKEASPEDLVSIFCNLTKKEVRMLGVKNIGKIFETVSQIPEQSTEDFSLVYKVELEGKRYGLIPNFDKMSYGEYLDLTEYMKDTQANLEKVMSVLYRPIVEEDKQGRYLIKEYTGEEDYKIMLNVTMDVVFSVLSFFFDIANRLLSHIPTYMEQKVKEMEQTSTELSEEDGERINKYINSLKEILQDSTKLQPSQFTNV